jgi:hypothetical protein
MVAEVSLAQGPPVPGYPRTGQPFVALALGEDGEEDPYLVPLSVDLAVSLGRTLVSLGRTVRNDEPSR